MGTEYTHNDSIIVVNVGGSSKDRYRIDGLYAKYLEEGGRAVVACQRKGCQNPATATAHVRMTDGRRSKAWLLTRLCAACNHYTNDSEMALRKNARLVSVAASRGRRVSSVKSTRSKSNNGKR